MFEIDLNLHPSAQFENEEDIERNQNDHSSSNRPNIRINLNCFPSDEDEAHSSENMEANVFYANGENLQHDMPVFDFHSFPYHRENVEEDHSTRLEHIDSEFPLEDSRNMEETREQFQAATSKKKRHFLSNKERQMICNILLTECVDGRLRKGTTERLALQFSIGIRTVHRIWNQLKSSEDARLLNVCHKKTGRCGRKRISFNPEQVREIPLRLRTTLRCIAKAMNVGKSTVHRYLKRGWLRRHSNSQKPFLTEENKRARLKFCISMLEEDSIHDDPIFKGMYNVIHIDEKWFYITRKSQKFYLVRGEEDPLCACKNKNYIDRVMFLVAIARPRFDAQFNEIFSGKIGVFPFVTQQPAKRRSVNRPAGTMETKVITSITRDVIRSFMIEKLLPAIKEKWPSDDLRYPIIIQQDNARPHVDANDHEFLQAARNLGLDIHLMCQPPNSPDLNVLDLGFFNAIQSLQYQERMSNVDDIVSAVQRSYECYTSKMCNRNFLSLQLGMIEIMKTKGCNKSEIPHINKEKLEREGHLPIQFNCDRALVEEVLQHLRTY